jgi:ABC-type molybdate transport system substrate-binding protein
MGRSMTLTAAAKALIAFLASPAAAEAVKNSGMDPIAPPAK